MISFDIEDFFKSISEEVSPEVAAAVRESFRKYLDEHMVDGVIYPDNPPEIKKVIALMVSKIETIPKKKHGKLFYELNRSTELQENIEKCSTRVSKFFGNVIDARSTIIAQTVSNSADNAGRLLAARTARIFDRKLWLTRRDNQVRPLHASMDGIEVPIEGKFELANGDQLDFPGDPTAKYAESIMGCRCVVICATKETKL